MFSPLYLKIFEKSPILMKTPSQNLAHHTEVKKHPFGVKTPNLATLFNKINLRSASQHTSQLSHNVRVRQSKLLVYSIFVLIGPFSMPRSLQPPCVATQAISIAARPALAS